MVLEEAFETWGRPLKMRFDNGVPWGTAQHVPSALCLWIVGLGIEVIFGRPACSTDNALVERSHGVLAKWVEPQHCWSLEDCQDRLDWAVETQRERYHAPKHLSRAQAYPELYTNSRTYCRAIHKSLWCLQTVAQFLSTYHFERKVEKNGQISLLATSYLVGRSYARQHVLIHLDPHCLQWVVEDTFGRELVRHPCQELAYEKIHALKLAKRRKD